MNVFKRIKKPKERAITLNGLLQLSHMQRHVICWTLMAETVRGVGGWGGGVPFSKPLGGSKVDSAFHPSEDEFLGI